LSAFAGPLPEGDQAVIRQRAVLEFARTARAIEPPMSPKPTNPRSMVASIAAGRDEGVPPATNQLVGAIPARG
jgi:hypothetical protein